MCFTPKISLTTALIEFISAGFIYHRYPKSKLMSFFLIVLVFLGIYQLSEFFLCVEGSLQIWGKLGFFAYTLIPAFILYSVAANNQFKKKYLLFFLPPAYFIAIAIFDKNFVSYGVCSTLFVTIRNRFLDYENNFISSTLFSDYYAIYIALTCIFLLRKIKKSSEKKEKLIYALMMASIPLAIIPPLIFVIIFPSFFISFPSIYCQFAMLITLTALIGLHYENKLNLSK